MNDSSIRLYFFLHTKQRVSIESNIYIERPNLPASPAVHKIKIRRIVFCYQRESGRFCCYYNLRKKEREERISVFPFTSFGFLFSDKI